MFLKGWWWWAENPKKKPQERGERREIVRGKTLPKERNLCSGSFPVLFFSCPSSSSCFFFHTHLSLSGVGEGGKQTPCVYHMVTHGNTLHEGVPLFLVVYAAYPAEFNFRSGGAASKQSAFFAVSVVASTAVVGAGAETSSRAFAVATFFKL